MCLLAFYGNSFLDCSNWVGGFVYGFLMVVKSFQHMCVRSHISVPASCVCPVCSNSDSAFLSQNSKGFCARLTTAPLREAEPALACQAWSQTLGGNAKCNMGPARMLGRSVFWLQVQGEWLRPRLVGGPFVQRGKVVADTLWATLDPIIYQHTHQPGLSGLH